MKNLITIAALVLLTVGCAGTLSNSPRENDRLANTPEATCTSVDGEAPEIEVIHTCSFTAPDKRQVKSRVDMTCTGANGKCTMIATYGGGDVVMQTIVPRDIANITHALVSAQVHCNDDDESNCKLIVAVPPRS